MSENDNETATKSNLTDAQKARIERNRTKALHLRSAKLTAQHPYAKEEIDANGKKVIKVQGTKFIDSGGGFLIEQPAVVDKSKKPASEKNLGDLQGLAAEFDEPLQIPVTYEQCLECPEQFAESYLFSKFDYAACDNCRDSDDKHSLITRTDAKSEYLLKDCDLDKREPPLKFICRKNPHNVRWGDMKLYLHLQIEKRALEVWGSEEELIKERELRDVKRDKSQLKKYNKNLKQLRMEVRSSLFNRTSSGPHKHEYGEETYNEEEDTYSHICTSCGFKESYEKM